MEFGLAFANVMSFGTGEGARTLGQAALKWLLAEPLIMSCLPNIYDDEQLEEFAAACETPARSVSLASISPSSTRKPRIFT